MNKITGNLSALFIAILIWQSSCANENRSEIVAITPSTSPTPMIKSSAMRQTVSTDLKTSEIEAQALLDVGIKFDFTSNADGVTKDGGLFTGHSYITSDSVQISTSRGLYTQVKNAKKVCGDVLKETDKILKKERIDDGERIVARKKGDGFVVAVRSGSGCNIYESSSLKHLLAFEKWRDK
ncbi:MAG: hypothetical protein ICV86_17435 [Microcoleus sp. T3-bin5]|nr:hypothetical protein [Microcoleus sp. T3-bin5]